MDNLTTESAIDYMRSRSGRLIVFQTVISLTAFILILTETGYHPGAFKFFAVLTCASFLMSLCLLVAHFSGVRKSMTSFPWLLTQVIAEFTLIGLFFISSTLVAAKGIYAHSGSAATMGFFLMVSYCNSLYTDFKIYRTENSAYDPQTNSPPEYPTVGQETPGMPPPQYPPPQDTSSYQSPLDTKQPPGVLP